MKKKCPVCGRIFLVSIVVLLIAWGVQSSEVLAEKYPSKPVELICTLSAGGQTDLATRMLAEGLKGRLDQPVVVINKPGAAGMLGTSYMAKAKPDGYTIASIGDAQTISAFLLRKPPYTMNDIRAVAQWGYHNTVMIVPSDSPWKTMKDFIEYAKKNPGVKYAHMGKGGSPWVRVEFLASKAGIKLTGVPFKARAALTAVMGNQVPIGIAGYAPAKAQAKAGKVRILMGFTPGGIAGEPDLPTLEQVLGKDIIIHPPIMAIFVPAGTPDSVVKTLDKAIKETTSDPAFKAKMTKMGIGVGYANAEQFHKRLEYMTKVIKDILLDAGMIK